MHRQKKIIYEVTLKVKQKKLEQIHLLKELLIREGFEEREIIEVNIDAKICLSVYLKNLNKAKILKRRLSRFHLTGTEVHFKSLKNEDWKIPNRPSDFKPFLLTQSLVIVPQQVKARYRLRNKKPLFIDHGFAFGSGRHPTTQLMAQFVERCYRRFKSFLDIGTGSGILTIVALNCGAVDIMAIDTSREAVKSARKNICQNGYSAKAVKKVDLRNLSTRKKYDFVAANLVTSELIQCAKKIVALVKPGQYLAISGISLNNYERFRAKYDNLPLRCLRIKKEGGWVALLYKKKGKSQ